MAAVFKLNPAPTFRAVVDIPVPGGEPLGLECEFRHQTRAALKDWIGTFAGRDEADVLMDIVAGWHNADAGFSRDALDLLLQNYAQAGTAILARYTAELTGARLGN